ncbi:MAG: peptide chain release factor N(5)-glutamine methyltransferase [Firmicutes bacterium]|nr:peptide chain release factor N(5)-glutamine methyltransferase [Bacillota bacterium]
MIKVKEALQRASLQLQGAGITAARREAEILLSAVLKKTRAWLYAHDEEIIESETYVLFQQWVERRAQGEPFAYLCGEREFMGLPFVVTPAVLIPRPETEILVEAVVQELQGWHNVKLLEVGVGSGAIAISLATLLPYARITAVDISPAALAVAAFNSERLQVAERLSFLAGDLYAPVRGQKFTAVISNPPYISAAEYLMLDKSVKNYEPRVALDGGPDGLTFYRRLSAELKQLAAPPQLLALEVGQGQAAAVSTLCREAGYQKIKQIPDLAGIPRVVLAKL